MKNIYSFTLLLLFSVSLFGQGRIYPPNLNKPENGAVGQAPDAQLNWYAVTGITTDITYEVQISVNPDLSDPITLPRTDLTAMNMSNLNFGVVYYWHVRAYDGEVASEWSVIWSFKVIGAVVLKLPNNGSMVYSNPEITWNAITGLTSYQMQIDTSYEWKAVKSGTTQDIKASFVIDENNMWAAGANGLILHFDGSEWMTSESGSTATLNSLYFVSETDGYAVGNGGVILHYNGSSWSEMVSGVTKDLTGIAFADANNGWAVGSGGTIVKYTGTWAEETSGTTNDLTGISAVNSSDVWACGKSKTILHFNGSSWTSQEVGTRDFSAISFSSPSTGWAVGKSGTVFMYDGMQWFSQNSGTSKDLLSVSFDGMSGYAVGKTGTLITYSGSWSLGDGIVSTDLNTIYARNGLGLFGGASGTLASKTGAGFDSPYVKQYSISKDSISKRLTNLLFGETFYYRMRALNSMDTSGWSGAKSFTTYASPELLSPDNGSTGANLRQLYKWKKYGGVIDYFFQISEDPTFETAFEGLSDSTSILYTIQKFGTEYFWRVSTANPDDNSDWSPAWSFTTLNKVTLSSPANEATNVNVCPKYQWVVIPGAASYELSVASNPDFTDATSIMTNLPYYQCQDGLAKNTVFYWKTRAYSSIDTTNWSDTWSFKTEGYIGIIEQFGQKSVEIYPNPSNGTFTVGINSASNSSYELKIVDLTGRTIYEIKGQCSAGDNKVALNLEYLNKGIYMVSIRKEDETVTKKLSIR
ncbi:MAG TPA: T9SS type A sorting domain-containing protein [Bacteroidales bacterium]